MLARWAHPFCSICFDYDRTRENLGFRASNQRSDNRIDSANGSGEVAGGAGYPAMANRQAVDV